MSSTNNHRTSRYGSRHPSGAIPVRIHLRIFHSCTRVFYLSGPKRYDYVPEEDDWIYSRDAGSMGDLLNSELTKSLGRDVDLGIRDVSQ